jgi:Tfp pilus assembly protein PilX
MRSAHHNSRGYTLIASLLLMLLMSGFACGLFMLVNTEQLSGGYDLNNNYAYHAAEGAMEKMSSDLASTFTSIQSPTTAQICALSNNVPTWDSTITYNIYSVAPAPPAPGANPCSAQNIATYVKPTSNWGTISSGSNMGLNAMIIPVTMNVQVQRASGQAVNMTRTAEVALIPVFQFGVFSDSDVFFGRSPNLGFAGRLHTNGDLYLGVADGYNLVFGDKLAAYGNVIRQQMDNGVTAAGNNDGGTVMIPTTAGGCASQLSNIANANPSSSCVDIASTALGNSLGSVIGGHGSAQNTTSWKNVSQGVYYNYLIDGNGPCPPLNVNCPNSTGATNMTLPFVSGAASNQQVQIIRRPPTGESPTSLLGNARLANEAQIRVLLSDKESDLHLNGQGNDADDVYLSSLAPAAFNNIGSSPFSSNGFNVNNGGSPGNTYYFGESYPSGDPSFVQPISYARTLWTGLNGSTTGTFGTEWPILGGWLRVEVKYASDGLWHPVTREWLGLGFARGLNVPTQPGRSAANAPCTPPTLNKLPQSGDYTSDLGCNFLPDHTNAILYFQQTADRDGNGQINNGDVEQGPVSDTNAAANLAMYYGNAINSNNSQYNWYPINLYDAREGENYDHRTGSFPYSTSCGGSSCTNNAAPTGTSNGVMNVVELDVGNLRNWLWGYTGTNGPNVDFTSQNGYILYFSDRRGENVTGAAAAPVCTGCAAGSNLGEYGFEDTVNYSSGAPFWPDNKLEPVNYNGISPEDVNGNNQLDTYGVQYVGDAFGAQQATDTDATVPANPYKDRFQTFTVGRANRVTGARHGLKLVDGSLGNVPTQKPGNAVNNCSFTKADGSPNPTGCGGFTVASENPVYIQGNYNSNCPANVAGVFSTCTYNNNPTYDQTWTNPPGPEPNHSAAAIIADAVTLLSNNWQDGGALSGNNPPANYNEANTYGSLANPVNLPGPNGDGQNSPAYYPNRLATTTYYRVAIAGGKNIAFVNTSQNPEFAFGMDGGVHNFLRFLEDWGGIPTTLGGDGKYAQLRYKGSIVSLYWAMYATGTFKCCGLVYNPPDRQYVFDSLFSTPTNLPPGTPMFRNVDDLSYRQNQVARQQ